MSTNVAKPGRVAILGASGTYGKGILARAEEIGVGSIYDHGDFCLYCVASSERNGLAPHVSSGPQRKRR